MSLIYPEEAWRRFGPPPIAVHDAHGQRLRFVVACDPITGEVIQIIQVSSMVFQCLRPLIHLRGPIYKLLRRRFDISTGGILQRHYFAPAPLTISRVDP